MLNSKLATPYSLLSKVPRNFSIRYFEWEEKCWQLEPYIFIALTSKINNPKIATDHKPIVLYNVCNKTISKVLENQLEHKLLHQNQNMLAFQEKQHTMLL